MKRALEAMAKEIGRHRKLLLATHINPDGDALGSLLALGAVLESLGKEVFCYSEEPAPSMYAFLPGHQRLMTTLPETLAFDAAIALDCGDRFRLGREMERLLTIQPFMVIDHHVEHKEFGDLEWVEPGRAATGEMVYELAKLLGAEISPQAAFCLYTAIVSDTGGFRYAATTAETFAVARDLVLLGVDPAAVAGWLFNNYSCSRMRLLQAVLANLEICAGERIAIMSATMRMLADTGTTAADTEGFINYALALQSVQVAAFIREGDNGRISVSLRSKGEWDVAAIATRFGGGGHRNAAGFRLPDRTIAEVRQSVIDHLMHMLAHGNE